MKKYSFMLEANYQEIFELARKEVTTEINSKQKYQIDDASASQVVKMLLDFWNNESWK